MALGQGAALYYATGGGGIKDFDVWTFFAAHPDGPFPYRRVGHADFGLSKFGRNPDDHGYVGRRIDLLGRSLAVPLHHDPEDALVGYLTHRRTTTAKRLAEKAVVLIEPEGLCGEVVWPPQEKDRRTG